ncbi:MULTISPECIES: SAM-dependent methyltransferase [unclassified Frankia]|uniref:class I SAM-dependent methyltransferase n=1 Tax=unclassified Frankia TaxID=2632575 RepID=UPI001EF4B60C|nr:MULTISPECIES: SAM-dependent methyltransferase [unclassified Frankia]
MALTAAAARAAHLLVDKDPTIFSDPLAAPLLGEHAAELISYHQLHGSHLVLAGARVTVLTRARFVEDCLTNAVRRGVGQYVILGAGLDSFAYRSTFGKRLRVFEVDHPLSQDWKRHALAKADIFIPDTVSFVPFDLRTGRLLEALEAASLDLGRPAFVSCLGVAMYLPIEVVDQTMALVGGLATGTEIVVEHMLPANLRDAAGQGYVDAVAPASASHGEPWLTFLSPDAMARILETHGFDVVEQVGQRQAVDTGLWQRNDSLHPYGLSNLTRAIVRPARPFDSSHPPKPA